MVNSLVNSLVSSIVNYVVSSIVNYVVNSLVNSIVNSKVYSIMLTDFDWEQICKWIGKKGLPHKEDIRVLRNL